MLGGNRSSSSPAADVAAAEQARGGAAKRGGEPVLGAARGPQDLGQLGWLQGVDTDESADASSDARSDRSIESSESVLTTAAAVGVPPADAALALPRLPGPPHQPPHLARSPVQTPQIPQQVPQQVRHPPPPQQQPPPFRTQPLAGPRASVPAQGAAQAPWAEQVLGIEASLAGILVAARPLFVRPAQAPAGSTASAARTLQSLCGSLTLHFGSVAEAAARAGAARPAGFADALQQWTQLQQCVAELGGGGGGSTSSDRGSSGSSSGAYGGGGGAAARAHTAGGSGQMDSGLGEAAYDDFVAKAHMLMDTLVAALAPGAAGARDEVRRPPLARGFSSPSVRLAIQTDARAPQLVIPSPSDIVHGVDASVHSSPVSTIASRSDWPASATPDSGQTSEPRHPPLEMQRGMETLRPDTLHSDTALGSSLSAVSSSAHTNRWSRILDTVTGTQAVMVQPSVGTLQRQYSAHSLLVDMETPAPTIAAISPGTLPIPAADHDAGSRLAAAATRTEALTGLQEAAAEKVEPAREHGPSEVPLQTPDTTFVTRDSESRDAAGAPTGRTSIMDEIIVKIRVRSDAPTETPSPRSAMSNSAFASLGRHSLGAEKPDPVPERSDGWTPQPGTVSAGGGSTPLGSQAVIFDVGHVALKAAQQGASRELSSYPVRLDSIQLHTLNRPMAFIECCFVKRRPPLLRQPLSSSAPTARPIRLGTGSSAFASSHVTSEVADQPIKTFDSQGKQIGHMHHGQFQSSYVLPDLRAKQPHSCVIVHDNILHFIEAGQSVLVLEMVMTKFQVVAGTLSRLILRLADETIQGKLSSNFAFQKAVLADTLPATKIRSRFDVQPSDPSSERELAYHEKWKRSIQLKSLTVLARWAKLQLSDFIDDPELFDALNRFLDRVWQSGFKSEADRIRRCASVHASALARRRRAMPLEFLDLELMALSACVTGPAEPASLFPPRAASAMLEIDVRDLARYLAHTSRLAFESISAADYIAKLKRSRESASLAGGEMADDEEPDNAIDQLARRLDKIRSWVAIEVCSVRKNKVCRELNDFNTTLFVTSGLLAPAVQRLKSAWAMVSSQYRSTMEELETLLDPSGNMRAYRVAVAHSKAPFVPFLPVLMKDLTFAVEGNPDYVAQPRTVQVGHARTAGSLSDSSPIGASLSAAAGVRRPERGLLRARPAPPPEKLVNFDKFVLMYEILDEAMRGHGGAPFEIADEADEVLGSLPALLAASATAAAQEQAKRRPASWQALGRFPTVSRRAMLERIAVLVESSLAKAQHLDRVDREASMRHAWELSQSDASAGAGSAASSLRLSSSSAAAAASATPTSSLGSPSLAATVAATLALNTTLNAALSGPLT
ncbi:hypothetical protein HK105_207173 [Polyrhizophydium stewartii]|uniref:Ras guanine nucleotide exchange factor n=1 Tax=Polyrhizophydium stewartii TaxID=2732419 RepID=A0ABR4N1A7_9FUNG